MKKKNQNPNVKNILCWFFDHPQGTRHTPQEIAEGVGISIDATRRALKAALADEHTPLIKTTENRRTYYTFRLPQPQIKPPNMQHLPTSLHWKRVKKGRKVYDWFLNGKRLPKANRFAFLLNAGFSHAQITEYSNLLQ